MNASQLRRKLGRQKGECTWCGNPVPKGRRTWCSSDCVEAYRLEHDWQYIRSRVLDRDKGVCCACGLDCERLKRFLQKLRRREGYLVWQWFRNEYLSPWGFDCTVMDLWQADHIVPRVDGGGHDLSNLRTLCIPCHKRETKALAARRAAANRDQAAARRDQARPLFSEMPEGA